MKPLKHGRTAARVANTKKLIEALAISAMTRDDICQLLQLGPSGARKYITDLRESGIMEVSALDSRHRPSAYSLVDNPSHIAAFIADLDVSRPFCSRGARSSNLAIAKRNPGRHFHPSQDGATFAVRVSTAPVAPDPFALPAEFFARRATPEQVTT